MGLCSFWKEEFKLDNFSLDIDSAGRIATSSIKTPVTMAQRVTRSKSKVNPATNGHSSNGHTNGHLANGSLAKETEFTDQGLMMNLIHRTLMPLFLMFFSPNLVILLWYTAAKCDGSFLKLFSVLSEQGVLTSLYNIWGGINVLSPLAVYTVLGYMAFAAVLQLTMPGPRAEGPVTPKGNIPVYTDNGFCCYLVTMAAFGLLTFVLKNNGLTPTVVYDHFDEFLAFLTVFSYLFCCVLYIKGRVAPSSTDSGISGNPVFDFYWGTELYPRVFGIDIKVFTNCRLGMTVWPLLCLIFALKNYELYGFVDSCWITCGLQMIYFTKFFWWESGYMRTIDIMLDRAGFYICWGCLVYVPGLYGSVSLYMATHPVHLGPLLSVIIVFLGTGSIAVNYLADAQKQDVRNSNGNCLIWGKTPDIIRAKYKIESGATKESILLVSGYWAIARHFHYIPELALAFFWSLPGLFENIMVYVYFIWLCLLLTHRTFRDDDKCGKKYGNYWRQYCERVPYKMIPGVF